MKRSNVGFDPKFRANNRIIPKIVHINAKKDWHNYIQIAEEDQRKGSLRKNKFRKD